MLVEIGNRLRGLLTLFVGRTSSVNTEEPNVDEVTGQRAELPQCDEFPVHDQLLHSYADEDTVHCDELPQSSRPAEEQEPTKNITVLTKRKASPTSTTDMRSNVPMRRIGTRSVVAGSEGRAYQRKTWNADNTCSVKETSSTRMPLENQVPNSEDGEPTEKRSRAGVLTEEVSSNEGMKQSSCAPVPLENVVPNTEDGEPKRSYGRMTLRSHPGVVTKGVSLNVEIAETSSAPVPLENQVPNTEDGKPKRSYGRMTLRSHPGAVTKDVSSNAGMKQSTSSSPVPLENIVPNTEDSEPSEKRICGRMILRSHGVPTEEVSPNVAENQSSSTPVLLEHEVSIVKDDHQEKRMYGSMTLRAHAGVPTKEALPNADMKATAATTMDQSVKQAGNKQPRNQCPHVDQLCPLKKEQCCQMTANMSFITRLRDTMSARFHAVTASLAYIRGGLKTTTPDKLIEKIMKKQEADAANIKREKLVATIGNGVNQYKVMCDPEANPAPPKFTLIEKNIIDSNLLQDEKKVQGCGAECSNGCRSDCPCVIASIVAGKCFLHNGYLQADGTSGTEGTGFHWNVAANACNENCSCKGGCTHGVLSQKLVTTAQLRFISPEIGYGVFATEPILKGKLVFEFTGEIKSDVKDGKYAFQICADNEDKVSMNFLTYWNLRCNHRNVFVDPKTHGNIARFVNHAEAPNLDVFRCFFSDHRPEFCRLYFYAIRDIPAGAELLVDYGPEYIKEKFEGMSCLCRYPICRSNPDLAGFETHEIVKVLEEVDKSTQKKLAEEGLTFAGVYRSWSVDAQQVFMTLSRALSARYNYYNQSSRSVEDGYLVNYLKYPKPLHWKDAMLSEILAKLDEHSRAKKKGQINKIKK